MQDSVLQKSIRDAMVLFREGRIDEALITCRSIAQGTRRSEVLTLMARMLSDAGRIEDAIQILRESATTHRSAQTLANLGMLLVSQDRADEAIGYLHDAITIDPGSADAMNNLGAALRQVGEPSEAVRVLQRAVSLRENFASAWTNLAGAMTDLENFPDAENAAQHAVRFAAHDPIAHYNLGVAMKELGRLDDAVAQFEKAILLRPGYVDALTSLGNARHQLGQYDAAIKAFRVALHASPEDSYAQWNLSLALLIQGKYTEAWPLYEARWRHSKMIVQRTFAQPQWNGEPLGGRRILLHCEQGLGDTLQFIRYAPMVTARGGRVTLLCQPQLERLLRGRCSIELVTSDEQSLPAFDAHCPILSLPRIFDTRLETIPAPQAYLGADPALVLAWRSRLGRSQNVKIGLNWAGSAMPISNRKRTIGLAAMAPLAAINGATFYSLQVGPPAAEVSSPPAGMKLIDCSPYLTDFSETAALMSALDFVVTCDTSIAHAAGAMGILTCVLLPSIADWRWMLDRPDSPWYPSMRLFRQLKPGDYATPLREVVAYLNTLATRA